MQNLKPNADGDLVLTSGSSYGRPRTILFTTQPPNVKGDDPDGQSECYMSPATKQQLLATKNYPQRLLQDSSPPAFRIGPAGKCGLGMFATRTIRNGEYVCTERPIMVMPAGTTVFGEVSRELSVNMTYGSMQQIMLAERELAHAVMFKRLKPKQQEEYMSLANWYVFQAHCFQRRTLRRFLSSFSTQSSSRRQWAPHWYLENQWFGTRRCTAPRSPGPKYTFLWSPIQHITAQSQVTNTPLF